MAVNYSSPKSNTASLRAIAKTQKKQKNKLNTIQIQDPLEITQTRNSSSKMIIKQLSESRIEVVKFYLYQDQGG